MQDLQQNCFVDEVIYLDYKIWSLFGGLERPVGLRQVRTLLIYSQLKCPSLVFTRSSLVWLRAHFAFENLYNKLCTRKLNRTRFTKLNSILHRSCPAVL